MYNVLPIRGSDIVKEISQDGDMSYVLRIQISETLGIILEHSKYNPIIFYPNKTYYLAFEDVDTLKDGFGHYIDYLEPYYGKMEPGIYCNFELPLYGIRNNIMLVNGYNGVIVGKIARKEAVLSYAGRGCPHFFYSNFLGVKNSNILHISINNSFGIPVNSSYEESWKIADYDGLHIFSCRFGYQGFNGEHAEYANLKNYLYVSGVILDENPTKLVLPTGKTYFEELN